jgi:UDP:flavonoid glycosyltransferase YjiC (YdhE family)
MIISGIGGLYPAIALAEKFNLPLVQAYYIPFTPTRAYPSFLMSRFPVKLNGSMNRLSYHLARQVFWQAFRLADNKIRQDELGIPLNPFLGPTRRKILMQGPILYGYSPAVLPRPTDWPGNIQVTGYWFLNHNEDWMPPEGLVDFLQAGEPPVFIGFGSMSKQNPDQTMQLLLKALEISNQRGIILSGWGGLKTDRLPESAFMVDSVPYSWLFPHTAAVVHHGGAGTTAAGLRAGVPSVVLPFFGDQPFWGRRVAELGVGPAPISQRKLTAEKLAEAILTAVNDRTMRQRAVELGAKIQAEDGIAKAIAVLQKVTGTVH